MHLQSFTQMYQTKPHVALMQDMFQGEISLEREVLGVIKHGWHFGVVSVVSDSWKGAEVGCHSTGCGRQMCRKSTVKITEYD